MNGNENLNTSLIESVPTSSRSKILLKQHVVSTYSAAVYVAQQRR
jgi:hypothetical protein